MTDPTAYELAQLARLFRERSIPGSALNHVKVPERHEIGKCLEVAGLDRLRLPASERTHPATGVRTGRGKIPAPLCIAKHGNIIGVVLEKQDHQGCYQGWYQRRMRRAYRLAPGSSEVMLTPSGWTTAAKPAYRTAAAAGRQVDEMMDVYTTLGSAAYSMPITEVAGTRRNGCARNARSEF